MAEQKRFRVMVLSVVKHDYIARAVANHPRFDLAVVSDDPGQPDWVHERNQALADEFAIPYCKDFQTAVAEHPVDVAVISSQAERHCDLAVPAADAGLHLIVDKPLSTRLGDCDRLVEAIDRAGVRCLIWNRNYLPAVPRFRGFADQLVGTTDRSAR